jgi:hypothetical protein
MKHVGDWLRSHIQEGLIFRVLGLGVKALVQKLNDLYLIYDFLSFSFKVMTALKT